MANGKLRVRRLRQHQGNGRRQFSLRRQGPVDPRQDLRRCAGTGGGNLQQEDATFDVYGNLTAITLTPAGGPGSVQNIPTNASTNRWTTATFDNAGNLTSVGGVTYEYDAFNNLKRWFSSPTIDFSLVYTAGDERFWVVRQNLTLSNWALRGLDGTILREYEAGGGVSWGVFNDTIYRGRTPVATFGSGGNLHLHTDHLGNLRMATNSAGSQWWYREYFPHGRMATKLAGADTEQHNFTGHERDLHIRTVNACSGVPCNDSRDNADGDDLDNMHARHYKAQFGRFFVSIRQGASVNGRRAGTAMPTSVATLSRRPIWMAGRSAYLGRMREHANDPTLAMRQSKQPGAALAGVAVMGTAGGALMLAPELGLALPFLANFSTRLANTPGGHRGRSAGCRTADRSEHRAGRSWRRVLSS